MDSPQSTIEIKDQPPVSSLQSPVLVAWDFNGVIDTYGSDLGSILQAITDQGGHNIVVSNGTTEAIKDHLVQRNLIGYFDHIYGMDAHQGLVVRHKTAAISGHIQDQGPFGFVLMIGDNLSDIDDGQEAGACTCLFDQHQRHPHSNHAADYVITNLTEVLDLLPV